MTRINSLFHRVEKEGARSIEVAGIRVGFKLTANGFMKKFSNNIRDPFSSIVFDVDTLARIDDRFMDKATAEWSKSLEEDSTKGDTIKAFVIRQRLNVRLPGRRFGFEIHDGGKRIGMAIEAIRTKHVSGTADTPYLPSEVEGKRFSDCNYFHIHFLKDDAVGDAETQFRENHGDNILLDNLCYMLSISESLEKGSLVFKLAQLERNLVEVAKAPPEIRPGPPINPQTLFFRESEERLIELVDVVRKLLEPALSFLWVLEREPQLVESEYHGLTEHSGLRRLRGLAPYSPVRFLRINGDELRPIEVHHGADVARALDTHGKISIPGLVYTKGYERKSCSVWVQAYARCADQVVRQKATELLRARDADPSRSVEINDELAQLLNEWGTTLTKQRLSQSPIYAARIVSTAQPTG
jgi:hypothetical protein